MEKDKLYFAKLKKSQSMNFPHEVSCHVVTLVVKSPHQ